MDELELARWQLTQRLGTLRVQIDAWIERSGIDSKIPLFRVHNSQIRAFDRLLTAVTGQLKVGSATASLADLRVYSRDLLGLFRVWEFLRAKLGQRLDDDLAEPLRIADGFAWDCFKPIADRAFKEPPLVFLNGGYSPYMLPRKHEFQAEMAVDVPVERRVVSVLTAELPFPVIGIPWYQVSAPWELPVLAHEVGHVIEGDLKLDLEGAMRGAVPQGSPRLADWIRWSGEVFADYFGCVAVGPAFVSSLAGFLAGAAMNSGSGVYPPNELRFALNLGFLAPEKAQELEKRWKDELPQTGDFADYRKDIPAIAATFGKLDVGLEPLTAEQYWKINETANHIRSKKELTDTYKTRELVAAIRIAFDRLVAEAGGDAAVARLEQAKPILIESAKLDIRRGTGAVDTHAKERAEKQRAANWLRLLREP